MQMPSLCDVDGRNFWVLNFVPAKYSKYVSAIRSTEPVLFAYVTDLMVPYDSYSWTQSYRF